MALEHPKRAKRGEDYDPKQSNLEKDPQQWVSGDEPMTDAQSSYLKTLSEEANEPFDPKLSKAEASQRIDTLREKTGKGEGRRAE